MITPFVAVVVVARATDSGSLPRFRVCCGIVGGGKGRPFAVGRLGESLIGCTDDEPVLLAAWQVLDCVVGVALGVGEMKCF